MRKFILGFWANSIDPAPWLAYRPGRFSTWEINKQQASKLNKIQADCAIESRSGSPEWHNQVVEEVKDG